MRDKVLEAIARYAEGGSIGKHLDDLQFKRGDFYTYKRKNPELGQLYLDVQEARADMMVDEAYEIGSDSEINPQIARVQADIRMKIAGHFDRARFGERVELEHNVKPSLITAIEDGKRRAFRPGRDLGQITEAQTLDITPRITGHTSDKQSEVSGLAADQAPLPDPFE